MVFPDHSLFYIYIFTLLHLHVKILKKRILHSKIEMLPSHPEINILIHRDVIWEIVMSLSYIKMSSSYKEMSYF